MGWNRANRDDFPMLTRDMVRQFFAHSSKEVFAVRLQEGLFKRHGVRISDYIRKDMTAKKSKWMGFAEVSSGGLENVVLTGLDRRGKGCSVRKERRMSALRKSPWCPYGAAKACSLSGWRRWRDVNRWWWRQRRCLHWKD